MISCVTMSKINYSHLKIAHLSHAKHDSRQLNYSNFFSGFRLAPGPRGTTCALESRGFHRFSAKRFRLKSFQMIMNIVHLYTAF